MVAAKTTRRLRRPRAAQNGNVLVLDLGRSDWRIPESNQSIESGRTGKQRIAGLAVLIEAQLIKPIAQIRKIARLPASDLASCRRIERVVIARKPDFAVRIHSNRVATGNGEN